MKNKNACNEKRMQTCELFQNNSALSSGCSLKDMQLRKSECFIFKNDVAEQRYSRTNFASNRTVAIYFASRFLNSVFIDSF
jgi:hypothetical protein